MEYFVMMVLAFSAMYIYCIMNETYIDGSYMNMEDSPSKILMIMINLILSFMWPLVILIAILMVIAKIIKHFQLKFKGGSK